MEIIPTGTERQEICETGDLWGKVLVNVLSDSSTSPTFDHFAGIIPLPTHLETSCYADGQAGPRRHAQSLQPPPDPVTESLHLVSTAQWYLSPWVF